MKKPRNCKTARDAAIHAGAIYFEDVRQAVIGDELACDILNDTTLKAIRVISLSKDWYNEVYLWDAHGATIKENINYQFTIRKEKRGQRWCWYAYRRVAGKLFKRYVGISEEITEQRLLKIAQALPG
jgi:hypothetical protein